MCDGRQQRLWDTPLLSMTLGEISIKSLQQMLCTDQLPWHIGDVDKLCIKVSPFYFQDIYSSEMILCKAVL